MKGWTWPWKKRGVRKSRKGVIEDQAHAPTPELKTANALGSHGRSGSQSTRGCRALSGLPSCRESRTMPKLPTWSLIRHSGLILPNAHNCNGVRGVKTLEKMARECHVFPAAEHGLACGDSSASQSAPAGDPTPLTELCMCTVSSAPSSALQ